MYISTGENLKGENFRPVTSINTPVLEKKEKTAANMLRCVDKGV